MTILWQKSESEKLNFYDYSVAERHHQASGGDIEKEDYGSLRPIKSIFQLKSNRCKNVSWYRCYAPLAG